MLVLTLISFWHWLWCRIISVFLLDCKHQGIDQRNEGNRVLVLFRVLYLVIGVCEIKVVKHKALWADTDHFFNYLSHGFILASKAPAMDFWQKRAFFFSDNMLNKWWIKLHWFLNNCFVKHTNMLYILKDYYLHKIIYILKDYYLQKIIIYIIKRR